ncbi:MAG: hypothetical protein ACRENP_21040, partial [Longimicrobiales bacterium]
NLAHLPRLARPNVQVPRSDPIDSPRFEVVYQFDQQELDFGIADAGPVERSLELPDFRRIAPNREVIDELFEADPPASLLFRTTLQGGDLRGTIGNGNWRFTHLAANGNGYGGQFAEVVTWRQRVAEDTLTLKLSNLKGPVAEQFIDIGPTQAEKAQQKSDQNFTPTVRVKIANLCSTNPLEWDALTTHTVATEDTDFRWLYGLFGQPALANLPIPQQTTDLQAFGVEDCFGGGINYPPPGP